ncbi:ankyrin repeat domain-containing protein 12-like [Parasteatoda tepidariorum]|uniref:ankyrin repeat domain-containing protein 12-like n=1 Tax=Parasteatoda tepidariorum TaxID=114398 RepID=UPI0039BC2C2B
MNSTDTIRLKEADIIRLIESYLDCRGLHMTLDALERETGIINAEYPEEVVLLRYLILDGRWQEAVQYIKRLPLQETNVKFVIFEMMKQKYVELICVYEELGNELYEDLGNAIAVCFSEMSSYCPCPVEYENLRKLASLTKLSEDVNYKDWNPFTSRRQCFQTVAPVLLELPGLEAQSKQSLMEPERLTDILVKGILYESSEEYCCNKAENQSDDVAFRFTTLEKNEESVGFNLSLHSWLKSVPWNVMSTSFVKNALTVEIDGAGKSTFKEKWTEIILQNLSDLPEDVTEELKHLETESHELRERFWNRRIENNMILDATDILKKAEGVIQRWEKLNFGKMNLLHKKQTMGAKKEKPSCRSHSGEHNYINKNSRTFSKTVRSETQTFVKSPDGKTMLNRDSKNFQNEETIISGHDGKNLVKSFCSQEDVTNENDCHTNDTVSTDHSDCDDYNYRREGKMVIAGKKIRDRRLMLEDKNEDKITSSMRMAVLNQDSNGLSMQNIEYDQESINTTKLSENWNTLFSEGQSGQDSLHDSKSKTSILLPDKKVHFNLNPNTSRKTTKTGPDTDRIKTSTVDRNKKSEVDRNLKHVKDSKQKFVMDRSKKPVHQLNEKQSINNKNFYHTNRTILNDHFGSQSKNFEFTEDMTDDKTDLTTSMSSLDQDSGGSKTQNMENDQKSIYCTKNFGSKDTLFKEKQKRLFHYEMPLPKLPTDKRVQLNLNSDSGIDDGHAIKTDRVIKNQSTDRIKKPVKHSHSQEQASKKIAKIRKRSPLVFKSDKDDADLKNYEDNIRDKRGHSIKINGFNQEADKVETIDDECDQEVYSTEVSGDGFLDEEQESIRDLLRAKEIIREKLLKVLKGNEDESKETFSEPEIYGDNKVDSLLTEENESDGIMDYITVLWALRYYGYYGIMVLWIWTLLWNGFMDLVGNKEKCKFLPKEVPSSLKYVQLKLDVGGILGKEDRILYPEKK